ncbi:MAG: hypothetical protein AAFR61_26780 [Bacteroidota bacterium]
METPCFFMVLDLRPWKKEHFYSETSETFFHAPGICQIAWALYGPEGELVDQETFDLIPRYQWAGRTLADAASQRIQSSTYDPIHPFPAFRRLLDIAETYQPILLTFDEERLQRTLVYEFQKANLEVSLLAKLTILDLGKVIGKLNFRHPDPYPHTWEAWKEMFRDPNGSHPVPPIWKILDFLVRSEWQRKALVQQALFQKVANLGAPFSQQLQYFLQLVQPSFIYTPMRTASSVLRKRILWLIVLVILLASPILFLGLQMHNTMMIELSIVFMAIQLFNMVLVLKPNRSHA